MYYNGGNQPNPQMNYNNQFPNQSGNHSKGGKKKGLIIGVVSALVMICIAVVVIVIVAGNKKDNEQTETNNKERDASILDRVKKQTKQAISLATVDGVSVIWNDDNTDKTAIFKITGDGSSVTVSTENNNASSKFVSYLEEIYDNDLVTRSKAHPDLRSIKITINGCEKNGYTVSAKFTE